MPPPSTIVVTGTSGLIGSALVARLRARGHRVRPLVRRPPRSPDEARWNPARGELDPRLLEGVDAVVHLAGAPIGVRWTRRRRRAIRDSRVGSTRMVAEAIAAAVDPPPTFLSGSAIGLYGHRGDEWLDERSAAGDDFLAHVTAEWEEATAPAARAGVRTACLRSGVVLAARGGALARLLPLFRVGLGGPLGAGRQWMSWISLRDEVRAIEHVLDTVLVRGAVNLVAPEPVRNADFAAALAQTLHRPAVLRVPALALRLVLGEMAQATLLASQRVQPRVLLDTGFVFTAPALVEALREVLAEREESREPEDSTQREASREREDSTQREESREQEERRARAP